MGYAQDLVNAGYGGYAGWGDAEAQANFAATGGSGKFTGGGTTGGVNGNGTGSSYNPVAPADYQKLQEQAYEMVKPYYLQLAKEAQGDYTRATQALLEDYQKGTKEARQQYAITSDAENKSLQNSLSQLGISFTGEQQNTLDDLNKRGMATYTQNPDGTPNVVSQSAIQANPDYTSTVANPANPNTMGRGGYEMQQLQQNQKLRQEAIQRTTQKNLAQAGFNLSKVTNGTAPGATPDPNADRSTMGSAELTYLRGREDAARQQQLTGESLAQKRSGDIQNIANTFAGIQAKEIPAGLTAQYLKNTQTDFVNSGV